MFQRDPIDRQVIELTKELLGAESVLFDPHEVSLRGVYNDELSLYRAKKNWATILETNFLLEHEYDYSISRKVESDEGIYTLRCHFLTACGRYAFWRLTNDQAPEAQYLIETAHIPNAESRIDDFKGAPDMRPIYDYLDDSIADSKDNLSTKYSGLTKVSAVIGQLMRRILSKDKKS